MVLATRRLTGTVTIAIRDALVTPFCADKVWQRLAVFCNVRTLAVRANAGVSEECSAASVLLGFGGVGGGLEAYSACC